MAKKQTDDAVDRTADASPEATAAEPPRATQAAPPTDTSAYVASVAAYWERGGFSHAAGEILGHLMVCEPADQTQAEIAAALGLSAGTVSTQLKILTSVEMVERVRRRGMRTSFYQVPRNMWTRALASETSRIAGLRVLADQGLAVLPRIRPDRIVSLDQMVRFFEHEWPLLDERLQEFLRKEQS